jgi:hypothetical protein
MTDEKKSHGENKGGKFRFIAGSFEVAPPLAWGGGKTKRDTVLEVSNQPLWLNRSSRHPRYLERRNPN